MSSPEIDKDSNLQRPEDGENISLINIILTNLNIY